MNESSSAPVNKEDVRLAISELKKKGEKLANESIRKIIGRGSFSTIHKYRKEIIAEGDLSDHTSVSAKILSLAESLSQSISEESTVALREKTEEFNLAIKNLSEELNKVRKSEETLSKLLKEERVISERLDSENKSKEIEIKEILNRLDLKDSEAKTYLAVLSEKDIQITDLKSSLLHSNDVLEHYRESVKEQRSRDILKHENEINSKNLEIQQARESNSVYIHKIQEAEKSILLLDSKITSLLDKNADFKNQNEINLALISSLQSKSIELHDKISTENKLRIEESVKNEQLANSMRQEIQRLSSENSALRSEKELIISKALDISDIKSIIGKLESLTKAPR